MQGVRQGGGGTARVWQNWRRPWGSLAQATGDCGTCVDWCAARKGRAAKGRRPSVVRERLCWAVGAPHCAGGPRVHGAAHRVCTGHATRPAQTTRPPTTFRSTKHNQLSTAPASASHAGDPGRPPPSRAIAGKEATATCQPASHATDTQLAANSALSGRKAAGTTDAVAAAASTTDSEALMQQPML